MTLEQFVPEIELMRKYQTEFFAKRGLPEAQILLQKAKAQECKVDKILSEIRFGKTLQLNFNG